RRRLQRERPGQPQRHLCQPGARRDSRPGGPGRDPDRQVPAGLPRRRLSGFHRNRTVFAHQADNRCKDDAGRGEARGVAAPSGTAGTAPERLLVVEDERDIRELLARSMRYAGFEVTAAGTGAEAVKAATRVQPNLIVLDVMLPDMDGYDVL